MKNEFAFKSIILAAGYGTRLKPVTDEIPKPLIPVCNRTIIENILINLFNAGITEFAVNTHHLSEMIENAIASSFWQDKVTFFPEKKILGTGGPVVNAKEFLNKKNGFILHNGDIFTDIDLAALLEQHRTRSSSVTMVLIDGPENKVAVDEHGTIIDILGKLGREGDENLMTYAGIACFSDEIFEYLPKEPEFYSIVTAILELMKENPESVASYQPSQIQKFFWNDLGTVEKMVAANKNIESGKLIIPDLISEDIIDLPMKPLLRQGSDRLFFRLDDNNRESRIAMCASDDNEDFERFVNIAEYLKSKELGPAEIYNVNFVNHTVIMEDLGNDTLHSLVSEINGNEEELEALYKKVIDWLVKFQIDTGDIVPFDKNINNEKMDRLRLFDYDYLRWETDYFKKNFLIGYCEIKKSEIDHIDVELHRLAEECLSHTQLMIHRDFQSQNILIKNGKIRIVDFQGARIGHIAYDLMSLVNDPYVNLSCELRKALISYYFELLDKSDIVIDVDPAILITRAALQRNMQALGAYSFLSMKKGKTEYQKFIPRGLELLKEVLNQTKNNFPVLQKIVENINI